MDTLKKAGAMLAHLELFHQMQDLRSLLQLAAHMEERGDRVTLISPDQITLIGTEMQADSAIATTKGAVVTAGVAYKVVAGLKGYESPEYPVNREELRALNTRAVAELEASDALRAFGETLAKIGATSATSFAPAEAQAERPSRSRRGTENDTQANALNTASAGEPAA